MIHDSEKKKHILGSSWEVPISPKLLSHQILVGKVAPPKTDISPEKCWLEDYVPLKWSRFR